MSELTRVRGVELWCSVRVRAVSFSFCGWGHCTRSSQRLLRCRRRLALGAGTHGRRWGRRWTAKATRLHHVRVCVHDVLTLRVTSRALCVDSHVYVVLSCCAAYVCVLSLFLFVAGDTAHGRVKGCCAVADGSLPALKETRSCAPPVTDTLPTWVGVSGSRHAPHHSAHRRCTTDEHLW